ncbi:hypothetical protein TSUD_271500 [Trifolium subterraneum]|uniref:RNase H type-1 domain-containing protein n=1 Tax=Trifolium subterraneum TaxID=3900 RepID=A0A2Z6N7L9_TRISU|nr:hypothetical protein TSUD_271500 [Trifolium subterraneum]
MIISRRVKQYQQAILVNSIVNNRESTEVMIKWKPLMEGWVKLNTNGAYKEGLQQDVLWGTLEGLRYARQKGYNKIEVNVDSMVVESVLRMKGRGSPQGRALTSRIRQLLDLEWEVVVKHSYREANKCPNMLANIGWWGQVGRRGRGGGRCGCGRRRCWGSVSLYFLTVSLQIGGSGSSDPDKGYTVQGAYQLLTSYVLATMDDAEKLIWHPQVPLKVSIFVWHLLCDSLLLQQVNLGRVAPFFNSFGLLAFGLCGRREIIDCSEAQHVVPINCWTRSSFFLLGD